MTSLTTMGLTPGLLVHALLLFALKNPLVVLKVPLVVFVAWVLVFFFPIGIDSIGDIVPLVVFVPIGV